MSLNTVNAGYVRINHAMTNLMVALRKGNRDDVVRIASHLTDDCDTFIEEIYEITGVTEADIVRIASEQDEGSLIKQAMWTPGQQEDSEGIPFPIPSEPSLDEPEAT